MVDLFSTITFTLSFSENVTSFPWSMLPQTIAPDQSAREDSLMQLLYKKTYLYT